MVLRLSVGLYLLAAALMLTTGLLGTREWYVALGCWLAGCVCLLSLVMAAALVVIGLAGPLATLGVISLGL
ncbi:hypothetical protein [Streptomyces sp. f150]|uniref:hypothetical protein n=1 Tax=Streptomyces sp. f150 TaxID=1827699 RepID=UPI00211D2DB8|nr:hypothetical protein [Streptomyces sp. f150]